MENTAYLRRQPQINERAEPGADALRPVRAAAQRRRGRHGSAAFAGNGGGA